MTDIPLFHTERFKLSAGTLELTYPTPEHAQTPLFQVAERINPKRAFVFVSNVLGRHIPVAPKMHRESAQKLAKEAASHLGTGPVLVMGYAETAVGLGAAVARSLKECEPKQDIHYLPTTRHPVKDHNWLVFEEGHSHATDQQVMKPANSSFLSKLETSKTSTLVLVDDESTTGNTFAGLALELKNNGLTFSNVILVTLTDWSAGMAEQTVSSAIKTPVKSISLFNGSWTWEKDENAEQKIIPTDSGFQTRPTWEAPKKSGCPFNTPRLGTDFSTTININTLYERGLKKPNPEENILVIGTGEHVWAPFLVAESFENQGIESAFLATTRSPILTGPVIKQKTTFADHFGMGLPMYLHNVNPQDWDHIVLMIETDINGICPGLAQYLPNAQIIDGNGLVSNMKDIL